jgi:hypothetical protein
MCSLCILLTSAWTSLTYELPMGCKVPKVLSSPLFIHSGNRQFIPINPFKSLGYAGGILVSFAHSISRSFCFRSVSDHLGSWSVTITDMSSHRWLLPLKWVVTGKSIFFWWRTNGCWPICGGLLFVLRIVSGRHKKEGFCPCHPQPLCICLVVNSNSL